MSSLASVVASVAPRVVPAPARARPTIAIVCASLDILGGHGVLARDLQQALEDEGYDVALVPVNPRFPPGLRWLRRVPYARTALNELLYVSSLVALRHADVVHAFSASYWSFLLGPAPAIAAARALGKRVVLHYHSGEADDHLAHWGRRVHPWLRLADAIVVPSAYLRDVFARYGYTARVIPNVVDLGRFRYRERRHLQPRLLSTRSLERHYGVDITIEAFAQVRDRHPGATLTLAGCGSQERPLREKVSSLGLHDAVRFVGRVEPEDMPHLCNACDVFVNASLVDNQPLSILEAFAAGLPVVSTPTGGIAEMVRDGETGVTVPARDPVALARALSELLDDPLRGLELARRARREAAIYTWPRVSAAWASVYQGVW